MYDILIKNGLIVDGSGKPAFYGDLAVKDGKIAKIAPSIQESADEVIDASGLQVAPGFIDNHSHSDSSVFTGSDSYNYLEQGVTTQVAGQCGSSPAPYSETELADAKAKLDPEEFACWAAKAQTPTTFMKAAEEQTFGTTWPSSSARAPCGKRPWAIPTPLPPKSRWTSCRRISSRPWRTHPDSLPPWPR